MLYVETRQEFGKSKQMTNPQAEYDSPWKEILEQFFEAFTALFVPQAHAEINWERGYESLDTELQQVTLDAEIGERIADKLIKVWLLDGEEAWVLVHIEVQSQYQSNFAKRMYVYNSRLFNKYDRRVASIAILGDEQPNWRPNSYASLLFGCRASLEYPIVKLLDYEAQWSQLEQSSNPFAIVVMAHLKAKETRQNPQSRRQWKMTLARRLFERGYTREDVIGLYRFIDWVMRLPEGLERDFREEFKLYQEENRMRYVTSFERLAKEEGKEEGSREATLTLILRQLTRRIGAVDSQAQEKIRQLSLEHLESLAEALLDFTGTADLSDWLNNHTN